MGGCVIVNVPSELCLCCPPASFCHHFIASALWYFIHRLSMNGFIHFNCFDEFIHLIHTLSSSCLFYSKSTSLTSPSNRTVCFRAASHWLFLLCGPYPAHRRHSHPLSRQISGMEWWLILNSASCPLPCWLQLAHLALSSSLFYRMDIYIYIAYLYIFILLYLYLFCYIYIYLIGIRKQSIRSTASTFRRHLSGSPSGPCGAPLEVKELELSPYNRLPSWVVVIGVWGWEL